MHRMITIHARPRQTHRRTYIIAIERRFVLTNASRAKSFGEVQNVALEVEGHGERQMCPLLFDLYAYLLMLRMERTIAASRMGLLLVIINHKFASLCLK